jgi:SAM-dependent methyltransferase
MTDERTDRDFYATHAQEYHERTWSLDSSIFLEPFARLLSPGSLVLDVGCSSGRDLLWLKRRGFSVVGLEGSPDLARIARETVGCEVRSADFEAFDFSTLSVDALCLCAALVHIPPEGLQAVLQRILKALRPRGFMLFTMKEGEGRSSDGRGRTFHLWRDGDLREMFDALRLEVLHFVRRESIIGTGEVWLEYVLRGREAVGAQ